MKYLCDILRDIRSISVPSGINTDEIPVSGIAYNSKTAGPGILFTCLVGSEADGHSFAADAYARGSRIFLAEHALQLPPDATVLLSNDTRKALAEISAAFFDHPERKLRVIGVTGTKGKSTICEMILHILTKNGISAGSIGTVGIKIDGVLTPTGNTTPESYELFRIFDDMVRRGCTYAVIEVSSQGIKMNRVYGIEFFAAVMTNLSEDHIGGAEHPDFEDYKNCKKRLFCRTQHSVFNADDPYYPEFAAESRATQTTYALSGNADMNASGIHAVRINGKFGTAFTLRCGHQSMEVLLPMPGEFSVYNALAALSVCRLAGISPEQAVVALADVSVPGRFELVETALDGITFIIDYAHNGESLRSALGALREYRPARLFCVFGSVGERTKLRRRELGLAASAFADFCIITSDNPGKEPTGDIIRDIEANMHDCPFIAIPDRKEALEYAVRHASDGDIVLVAGKGHENYQLIGRRKVPFCEREIIQNAALEVKKSIGVR